MIIYSWIEVAFPFYDGGIDYASSGAPIGLVMELFCVFSLF